VALRVAVVSLGRMGRHPVLALAADPRWQVGIASRTAQQMLDDATDGAPIDGDEVELAAVLAKKGARRAQNRAFPEALLHG
jgi:hypothetical protein